MQHLQKTHESNSIRYDYIRSVIKVWDVIVRITTVTLGSIISNPQMIESGKEDQDADDENWNRAIWVLEQDHTLLSNILTDIYNTAVCLLTITLMYPAKRRDPTTINTDPTRNRNVASTIAL